MSCRSVVIGLLCLVGGYACASASDAAGGAGGASGAGAGGFGGAGGSGGDAARAMLVLETEPSVGLMPSMQAEIVVRYVDSHEAPIANADVSFTLIGGTHDSGLSRLVTATDGAGHASTELIAGLEAASFQVRVSAADAEPIVIDVAISDRGFGNLRVAAPYDGVRLVTHRRVTLFAAETCAALDPLLTPDRQSTLTSPSEEARFIGLPAETRYALVAVAFGAQDNALAQGCLDDVAVVADSELQVSVTLQDVDLRPWGQYDLAVALNTSDVVVKLAESVRTQPLPSGQMTTLTSAEFLFDTLDQCLRADLTALPQIAAADALAQLRASAGADAELQTALDTNAQGPAAAQSWIADQVSAELAVVDFQFDMRIAPGMPEPTAAWTLHRVSTDSALEATGVIEHVVAQPIESVGTLSFVWSRDRMTVVGDVQSAFGALTVETIDAAIDGSGGTGRTHVLELLGCPTLAAWVETHPTIMSGCDATCVTSACAVGLSTMLSGLQTTLMTVDSSRPVISIGATFDMRDSVGDGDVDALDCPMLTATWQPDSTVLNATGTYMTGTATAARVGVPTP